MKRFTRIAAVGAAALGLLAGATPAHAAVDFGVIAFTGIFVFAPVLTYPAPGAVGSNGTWVLSTQGGAAVGAHTDGPQPGLAAGTASLTIVGRLKAGAIQQFAANQVPALAYLNSGGFCGLSGGDRGTDAAGIGITINPIATVPPGGGPRSFNPTNVGWIQSAASLIVFQGDTPKGKNYLAGVASVIPTTSSCVVFPVVGALVAFF